MNAKLNHNKSKWVLAPKTVAATMTVMVSCLTSLAWTSGASASGTEFLGRDVLNAPNVSQVHDAYLAGDFQKMTTEMKKVLEGQAADPLVKENMLNLLQKAYESRGSEGIPVEWHLPAEITKMKIAVKRSQRNDDGAKFSLKVIGNLSSASLIKQLRVTQYPDQVILDKQAGLGEFEDTTDPEIEYIYESPRQRKPLSTGLYLLRVELTNGKNVDGWFLVDEDMNATASPEILTPSAGEIYHTTNPTFRWNDFKSPQYKPYETRSLWMGVSASEPPNYNWDSKWQLFEKPPTLREATVGVTKEGMGASKLENGRYILVLNYQEQKRFGDIWVGRYCSTVQPFFVR